MNDRLKNSKITKILSRLFDTRAAAVYILTFAAAIGIATFIENDFGTSAAQKVIFKTRWFELLLLLFSITLVVNIVKFRMVQQKKWALLLFHSSMIVILIGAGVTRYFGYEGMMNIREDDQSNTFLSAESYILFDVINASGRYNFDEPVLFASLGKNKFKESYQIGNDLIEVELKNFIANPKQVLLSEDGQPAMLKIVFGGESGREEYFIAQGQSKRLRGLDFNFTNSFKDNNINLYFRNDSLMISADRELSQMIMATQERSVLTLSPKPYPLFLRSLYSDGENSFVFGDFSPTAKLSLESENRKVKNESLKAIELSVSVNGEQKDVFLYGRKGQQGRPEVIKANQFSMAVSYGSKSVNLPFNIKLHDFIMERYPGTNSAASYASEVQLIDARTNHQEDFRIYMNHILDYGGYRFFQSSFDKDEKGTYLSVNHDFWGTWISYLGYALLTLGLIMVFFEKKSRFHFVIQQIKKIRAKKATLLLVLALFFGTTSLFSQKIIQQDITAISLSHANKFSKIVVQDHKGRMKPMHTLTRELMRKMNRKESHASYTADQVVLSMFADKQSWITAAIIKISDHKALHEKLGVNAQRASYKDFFLPSGEYKLRDEVRRAYSLQPIDRSQLDKDVMKIDERVNIASMIYSGRIFRIIPLPNDENNLWVSSETDHGSTADQVAERFFPSYRKALQSGIENNDFSLADIIIDELDSYQQKTGSEVRPSAVKIKAEILLNKMNVFSRLSGFYALLGLVFLGMLFYSVFRPQSQLKWLYKTLLALVLLGFLFHTLGLGIRWYVSGRAPWSNGYESMIYIAWTTTLAGILFTRKSLGGLAATMILAGTILLVAMLSYLDPEITPLVPVLKSYWLTIHVSLIAGSYGFLMLGAIIGLINLILMILQTDKNHKMIKLNVKELSFISELTITGGLIMISIGTYLGGVWANESWGRYWGWDAKETWALVTILVYAFILHMRLVPGLQSRFAFNFATLFGFASVAMTYFGVNYYLSGLHSYAAGDPVPIPTWVYIAVVSVSIVSLLAFIRNRKFTSK